MILIFGETFFAVVVSVYKSGKGNSNKKLAH
jgi:hypothetical protein